MLDLTTVIPMTITSMEVAEMVGKEHNKLMRDIRRYSSQLGESKIGQSDLQTHNDRSENNQSKIGHVKIDESDFWNESTYQNSQNKTMPCYNVTKMGCEFIAHKMTGTKGTIFTALYVKRFPPVRLDFKQLALALMSRGVFSSLCRSNCS